MPFSLLNATPAGQSILQQNLQTAVYIQNGGLRNGQQMSAAELIARRTSAFHDSTSSSNGNWELGALVSNGLGTAFQNAYYDAIVAGNPSTLPTAGSGSLYRVFSDITGDDQSSGQLASITKDYFGSGEGSQSVPFATGGSANAYGQYYLNQSSTPPAGSGNPRPWQVAGGSNPMTNITPFQGYQVTIPSQGNPFMIDSTEMYNYNPPNVANLPNPPTQANPTNTSFPSGHTTFGHTSSIAFAMMVPELYQKAILRGATYGESRVYMGAHFPIDTIGGRILALYGVTNWLKANMGDNYTDFSSAGGDLRDLLASGVGGAGAYTANISGETWSQDTLEDNRDFYAYLLTYDLDSIDPQMVEGSTNPDALPYTDAEILLSTRFPYLSSSQRADIITTTLNSVDGPLDNSSLYGGSYANWSRINLFSAGGGYGSIDSDTTVTMDASKANTNSLYARDTWNNDISGDAILTKTEVSNPSHSHTRLTLSGDNSFGGVIVNGGELALWGANTFSKSTSVGSGAALVVENGGSLHSAQGITVNSGGELRVAFSADNTVQTDATFTNEGKVYLYPSPLLSGGDTRTPISSSNPVVNTGEFLSFGGSYSGETFTVSNLTNIPATNSTMTISNEQLDGQRFGSDTSNDGSDDIRVSFLDSTTDTSPYSLSAMDQIELGQVTNIGGQIALAAFKLEGTISLEDIYLSFEVGDTFALNQLTLWYQPISSSDWEIWYSTVTSLDGDYFSFTPDMAGTYAVTAVPEPSTLTLVGVVGLAFVVLAVRRRLRST